MPGCRCPGRGWSDCVRGWCGSIRFLRSETGTLEYAREAAGVLVGVIVAAKLLAHSSAGPSFVWLAAACKLGCELWGGAPGAHMSRTARSCG